MATVAFYVHSDYTPEDRQRLEVETGQLDETLEDDLEIDFETLRKTFGLSKRVLNPPKFVPATVTGDYWEPTNTTATSSGSTVFAAEGDEASVSGWYAALTRNTPTGTPRTASPAPRPPTQGLKKTNQKKAVEKTKNDWFIARALEASKAAERQAETEAGSQAASSETAAAAAPTLADILARDPPPLPTQEPFNPPVWLAIGPGNKGFDMLERSGWEEGQALGRASRNRSGLGYHPTKGKKVEGEDLVILGQVKKEVIDLSLMDGELVDLTVSDDEVESMDGFGQSTSFKSEVAAAPEVTVTAQDLVAPDLDHGPRALITPLPTVLKSDRLGIGLKAKTVGTGIYREPVRRVTHGQAALSAHIRANEKLQQMKKLMGRGRRGFERIKKREEEKRKNLMSYLNAD